MTKKYAEEYGKGGIYLIKNLLTSDCYVGSSSHISKRWSQHQRNLRDNKHQNKFLQAAVNKYGLEYFVFGTLENCENERLFELEQHYADLLKPRYNLSLITKTPRLGSKLSEEHKLKIAIANSRPKSEETKRLLSEAHKGKSKSHYNWSGMSVRWKPIIAYDGHTSYYFPNAKEAAKVLNVKRTSINNACSKNQKLFSIMLKYTN